jgi:drug/metabolite transporter (DMT)-like permease
MPPRTLAFLLLALASLMWSGNWVMGRALREAMDPIELNFWRWLLACFVLAPFAWAGLKGKAQVLRRDAWLLTLMALLGVSIFQSLVYLGLRTTEVVNAILLNSSLPLFILLCSWAIEREKATLRQLAGMIVSFAGIVVIVLRGELARLLQFEFHAGDAWILLAMPVWGVYAVLLKRRPKELDGIGFLFVLSVIGTLLLLPVYLVDILRAPPAMPTPSQAAGVIYMAVAASAAAFWCWNQGVAVVGANVAGFTLHLLPMFGTVLAIIFLGEQFRPFHAVGFATILAGVVLAARR